MLALERKHGVSMAIVLFVLVAWTFLPTLGNDFISYDDPPLIAAAHRGLSPSGLRWALTTVVIGNWQPLTCLSHLLFAGWCWNLGTLVPVIGLVQVGGQAMADRYTYLPSLGLLLLLVWAAHDLTRRWRWQPQLASVALLILLIASIAQTRWQIHFWKNSHTLFSHTVEVDPARPSRPLGRGD